jgi:hypothetical protein
MGGACSTHERREINILIRKSQGNKRFGRPVNKWENNNKIYLIETGREGMDLIVFAQWRALVNKVTNFGVP